MSCIVRKQQYTNLQQLSVVRDNKCEVWFKQEGILWGAVL